MFGSLSGLSESMHPPSLHSVGVLVPAVAVELLRSLTNFACPCNRSKLKISIAYCQRKSPRMRMFKPEQKQRSEEFLGSPQTEAGLSDVTPMIMVSLSQMLASCKTSRFCLQGVFRLPREGINEHGQPSKTTWHEEPR